MKLSTKGRYGTRLMLDLAIHDENGPVLLREISKRLKISQKYLWQLIPPLKNAGLLLSVRGSKGGYKLAKRPKEINLFEILSALEGPLCFVDCVDDPSACKRNANCVIRDIWLELSQSMAHMMCSITLWNILQKHKDRNNGLNYSI
jgi:Rrf2 family protein